MRFSLTSLVRLIALGALSSSLVAVGFSRAVPKAAVVRTESPPRYVCVNGTTFAPAVSGTFLLDTESGVLSPLGRIDGITVDYASCSPWSDGRGLPEVVGRATSRQGVDADALCLGLGLVRMTVPGPTIRSHFAMDPVVIGRPCWLPGESSRVVFPAGDGLLYLQDLHEPREASDATGTRRVAWACPTPRQGSFLIGDPVLPVIPSLGGRLFVTFSYCDKLRVPGRGRSEVWWLKLDPEGRSIVDAGRLCAALSPDEEVRLPNVSVTPDGGLAVAYMTFRPGDSDWHLWLAPIAVDPSTGVPTADVKKASDLGTGFGMSPPAFSVDGRWVFAVRRELSANKAVERVSVLDALGRAGATRCASRSVGRTDEG